MTIENFDVLPACSGAQSVRECGTHIYQLWPCHLWECGTHMWLPLSHPWLICVCATLSCMARPWLTCVCVPHSHTCVCVPHSRVMRMSCEHTHGTLNSWDTDRVMSCPYTWLEHIFIPLHPSSATCSASHLVSHVHVYPICVPHSHPWLMCVCVTLSCHAHVHKMHVCAHTCATHTCRRYMCDTHIYESWPFPTHTHEMHVWHDVSIQKIHVWHTCGTHIRESRVWHTCGYTYRRYVCGTRV